jgi:hypothetical protein
MPLPLAVGLINGLPHQVVEVKEVIVVGAVDAMEDVDAVDNSKKCPSVILASLPKRLKQGRSTSQLISI